MTTSRTAVWSRGISGSSLEGPTKKKTTETRRTISTSSRRSRSEPQPGKESTVASGPTTGLGTGKTPARSRRPSTAPFFVLPCCMRFAARNDGGYE
ncbi:unnamed protein product [Linum trigynum]|uniref:Uncharacterized protein n=1 Tax=Linum trigynum TaxID=586398 RepID=A0AAV2F7Z0_9ROSI